jgi:hypothetical protein
MRRRCLSASHLTRPSRPRPSSTKSAQSGRAAPIAPASKADFAQSCRRRTTL